MDKTKPTLGKILLAAGFALSSFALLLFLWVAFGGPTPLAAKGYRVNIRFTEAVQLATEADVRVSGVTVGRVAAIKPFGDRYAQATVELEPELAPLPTDSRAILRTKTLLGETYVELTPGSVSAEPLPEGGTLARGRVAESVQLDEVLRTFDPATREDLRRWIQGGAGALRGRAADLNAALATLDPFARTARDTLEALDGSSESVSALIREGGAVLGAISRRPGSLRGLIRSGEGAFSAIADRDKELTATFDALPAFLGQSRRTLAELGGFSDRARPLVRQLQPAARELDGTASALASLVPGLDALAPGLDRASRQAEPGFEALRGILGGPLPELLGGTEPWLDQVTPQVEYLRAYRREVTAFVANLAAASNAINRPPEANFEPSHYLRTINPLGPEALTAFSERSGSSRANAYLKPGAYLDLGQGLASFADGHCSGPGATAILDPADAGSLPGDLFERIRRFAFAGRLSSDQLPVPACTDQGPVSSYGGPPSESTAYPHVNPLP